MSLSWYLMQFFLRGPPQVPLGMIFSVLTITWYSLAAAWSSRPVSPSISRQELMDVLHLAVDWP